jgi:LAS superfamily LD-carboxypeptidase LdcB
MSLTPQAEHRIVYGLLGSALIILLGSNVYLFSVTQGQEADLQDLVGERNKLLEENVSITNTLLEERELASSTISELSERLSLTAEELDEIERDLRREKDRNEEFEDQLSELAGTIGVLDKLSKTDKELLQKYSRTYFLNENFVPMKLSLIPDEYLMNQSKDMYFHGDALEYLEDMLDAAKRAGHDLKIVSAFRSFDEQREVKNGHTIVYGSGANAFSADQGYSEHQLGTTVDIVDTDTYNLVQSFGTTEAFAWLEKNAYRYGFILSYPEGNQFYIYEPWHWRFVGRDLARDLHDDDKSFYDLDQRELDKYLVSIFD